MTIYIDKLTNEIFIDEDTSKGSPCDNCLLDICDRCIEVLCG